MKKRLLAILICVFMVAGLLPGTALAADSTSVTVGGVELDGTAGKTYWKNGDITSATGTETDYNAYFDSSTGTLTLKNAAITGAPSDSGHTNSNYGIYAYGDLTITLEGTNTVTADAATDYGVSGAIYGASNLTINGSGSLSATGGTAPGFNSVGIYGSAVAIQDSATVIATGGKATGNSEGINANSSLIISGSASVTATGGSGGGNSCGMYVSYGDIIVYGSATVTATGGSSYGGSSCGMWTDINGGVNIEGGTVIATGGYAPYNFGSSIGIHSGNESITYTGGLLVAKGGNSPNYNCSQAMIREATDGANTVAPLTGAYDESFAVYGATDTYHVIQDANNLDYTGVSKPTNVENHITWSEAQGLEPATLTLNNVIINTVAAEAIKLPDGAKLVIQNRNIVYNYYVEENSKCIYGAGALEISGTGALTAIVGDAFGGFKYSHGVYALNGLTVSGSVAITAIGGAAANSSCGVYSGTAAFSGGTITAIGGAGGESSSYGVYSLNEIQISESVKLIAIGGVSDYGSTGISSTNNTITISGGVLTAIGGAANFGSSGISSADTTTISGGHLVAIGGAAPSSHSIHAGGGGIALTDVSIIAPAGAGISDTSYFIATTVGGNIPAFFACIAAVSTPTVPPTASSVIINGTPSVGETITGGYTYNPGSVSDEGSSTFRWLQVSGTESLLGHPYLLYTTNNTGGVRSSSDGPTNPTRFTVTGTTHVAKISNYHYGYGYVSGDISLVDENSTVYGPWSTTSDGYWSAYPDIELPAGTYTVIDSEPRSWSFNNESGNAGMTEIVGYTVITGAEAQTYTLQTADVGHHIMFEVTPEDADGNRGEASLSDVFGPVRTPVDTDGDGVPDHIDNAPSVYNPDQLDTDGDGVGDVVDSNAVTIGTLSGGTIAANLSEAISGTTINLTIKPDSGKRLKVGTLKYNDGADHFITGTSFIMPGIDVTVTAEFESIPTSGGSGSYTPPKYAVTDSNQGTQVGGQTKLSKERAEAGDTVTITITPDKGYESSNPVVLDNNKKSLAITDNGDGTYSFKMPAGGVSVETGFTKIDYFDDVTENDWFDEASWYCAAHGLIQGTGHRQFDGHMGTNRAMLVTVLYRLTNSTDDFESIFSDVESGKWYSDAIGWAAHNKIVEGYGNGKFGPEDALTREQMVAVLYRYSMFMKYDVSKLNSLNTFTDADAISDWALEAMKWAVGNEIVEGVGNDLVSPGTGATRAQFAAMMQRYATTIVK